MASTPTPNPFLTTKVTQRLTPTPASIAGASSTTPGLPLPSTSLSPTPGLPTNIQSDGSPTTTRNLRTTPAPSGSSSSGVRLTPGTPAASSSANQQAANSTVASSSSTIAQSSVAQNSVTQIGGNQSTMTQSIAVETTVGLSTAGPTTGGQSTAAATTEGQSTAAPSTTVQSSVAASTAGQSTAVPSTAVATTAAATTAGQSTAAATTAVQSTVVPSTMAGGQSSTGGGTVTTIGGLDMTTAAAVQSVSVITTTSAALLTSTTTPMLNNTTTMGGAITTSFIGVESFMTSNPMIWLAVGIGALLLLALLLGLLCCLCRWCCGWGAASTAGNPCYDFCCFCCPRQPVKVIKRRIVKEKHYPPCPQPVIQVTRGQVLSAGTVGDSGDCGPCGGHAMAPSYALRRTEPSYAFTNPVKLSLTPHPARESNSMVYRSQGQGHICMRQDKRGGATVIDIGDHYGGGCGCQSHYDAIRDDDEIVYREINPYKDQYGWHN